MGMQRASQTGKKPKTNQNPQNCGEGNPTKTAKRKSEKTTLSPSGPPNNLLYQRLIVNQLAEAAGVCREEGSWRDNGLLRCITI